MSIKGIYSKRILWPDRSPVSPDHKPTGWQSEQFLAVFPIHSFVRQEKPLDQVLGILVGIAPAPDKRVDWFGIG